MDSLEQIWEIEGRCTSPKPCAKERVHEQLRAPPSIAYFCSATGRIWARRIVLENGKVRPWMCYAVPAPGQPEPFRFYPNGSLIHVLSDQSIWHTLPIEILIREFLLYADAYFSNEL